MLTCECTCGALLPIGWSSSMRSSNDEPAEVQIEMRAAELAACVAEAKATVAAGEQDDCVCFDGEQALEGPDEQLARWLSDVIHDREPEWDGYAPDADAEAA